MGFLENVRILLAAMGLENRLAEMVIKDIHALVEAITSHLAAVESRNKAQELLALSETAATLSDLAEADEPVISRADLRDLAGHLAVEVREILAPDLDDDPDETEPNQSTPTA